MDYHVRRLITVGALFTATVIVFGSFAILVAVGTPELLALPLAPLLVGAGSLSYGRRQPNEDARTIGWFYLGMAALCGAMSMMILFDGTNPWLVAVPTILVEVALFVGGVLLYRRLHSRRRRPGRR